MTFRRNVTRQILQLSIPIAILITPLSDVISGNRVAEQKPRDIWISAHNDGGGGKGTPSDPFDGSTEAKLDTILLATKSAQTIHFGRGTFLKRGIITGGAQVKAGQHWLGAGQELTTLKLSSMWQPAGAFIDYAIGNGSDQDAAGATIEDITIDCNATKCLTILGTNAVKADAIQLHGSRDLTVHSVRIINNHGDAASGQESFPLSVGGFTRNDKDSWCRNAMIDHVTIEHYARNHTHGGAISFYLVDGGVIQHCIVRGNKNGVSAYGFLGANCSLLDSEAIDCGGFFYGELNNGDANEIARHGGWRNFAIRNCKAWIGTGFRDNNVGNFGGWFCFIANGVANDSRGLDGLEVENNKIMMNRGAADSENGSTVHAYRASGVTMKNFAVKYNEVRRDPRSAPNPGGPYFRHSLNVDGVVYANNVFKDGWDFVHVDPW